MHAYLRAIHIHARVCGHINACVRTQCTEASMCMNRMPGAAAVLVTPTSTLLMLIPRVSVVFVGLREGLERELREGLGVRL